MIASVRVLSIAMLTVFFGFAPAAEKADDVWKASAAKVVITPDEYMQMSGYAGRGKADGKIHDLWAKALVLEDPTGRRGVLVSLDLIGVDRDTSLGICDELKAKYGFDRSAVILATSHTHTGPTVGNNLNGMFNLDEASQKQVASYTSAMQKKVVGVVGEAVGKLAPAKVAWGNGMVQFAVNRRTNKEPEVPKMRELGRLNGPVDHELPVLAVRDAEDKLIAIAFGYACHSTVLSFTKWTGDYPGFAQIELEKNHPGAIALFWAGCGADQNPLPRRTVAIAENYGKRLADGVEAVLGAPMQPIAGTLGMAYREVSAPLAELPTREQIVKNSMSPNQYERARARGLLAQIEKSGALRPDYPYPVQVWQLGSGPTWVTLGGEVVVDYSLRLKKELGPGRTWVMGYANDVMAYIPSLRVLKEGGYEGGGSMVYYGLPAIWGPRIEDVIVTAVREEATKARGAAATSKP